MLVKKTFSEILEFNHYAEWAKQQEEDTKLKYAINKVQKRISEIIEDYIDESKDIDIDHASTNEKGHIVKNEDGTYAMTQGSEKKCREVKKNHFREWKSKEFEFDNYIATEIPELSDEVKDILTGFVI